MNSKTLILVALGLFTSHVQANDGGIPYIIVDSVSSQLKNGSTMTFEGGEAFKLYSILPRDFVYDISRSLTITSDKRSLRISCQQDEKAGDEMNPIGDPSTTKCTVSIEAKFDPSKSEGDHYKWEPRECKK